MAKIFKDQGWTWYGGLSPRPADFEEFIRESVVRLWEDEDAEWVSSGRVLVTYDDRIDGVPYNIRACIEFEGIEIKYDSSPTTVKGDKHNE